MSPKTPACAARRHRAVTARVSVADVPRAAASDGRYADEVMEMFVRELRRSHTKPGEYEVKIFGGGRMFQHEGKDGKPSNRISVSERNVLVGRELVTRYGFRFTAEDLGGNGHRNVMLDLWSGDVWVKKPSKVTLPNG